MFNFLRLSKKDLYITKLWNSFYEKEILIEKYQLKKAECDAIIITGSGIYLFNIYDYQGKLTHDNKEKLWYVKGREEISFINPHLSLKEMSDALIDLIDDKQVPIFNIPLFINFKSQNAEDFYTLDLFQALIRDSKKVLTHQNIEYLAVLLKEKGNYRGKKSGNNKV